MYEGVMEESFCAEHSVIIRNPHDLNERITISRSRPRTRVSCVTCRADFYGETNGSTVRHILFRYTPDTKTFTSMIFFDYKKCIVEVASFSAYQNALGNAS